MQCLESTPMNKKVMRQGIDFGTRKATTKHGSFVEFMILVGCFEKDCRVGNVRARDLWCSERRLRVEYLLLQ
mgnify:CR=1 FL=1